jgi:hypothetical protein
MDETPSRAMTAAPAGGDPFDAYYFTYGCGVPYRRDAHWQGFFGAIADQIVAGIQPRRVLDAGCALGILVEALRTRGVDAYGIDVSPYAIEHVYEPMRPFCRLGSIADEFPDRYDLIVSIEVVEHMPPGEGEQAIANFCRHADDVLFSSTPSDRRELTHVNVQPAEYWAEQFARHGFFRDVDFDASFINPWAVRFRRSAEPLPRVVRNYERHYALLSGARHDARQVAAEMQRDLATALERMAALEAASVGGADQRAALDQHMTRLGELAAALEHQRCALLESRLDLDRERARVTAAAEADRGELRTLADSRAALEHDRAALEHDRAALERDHALLDAAVAALERDRAALDTPAHRRGETETAGHEVLALRASLEETHAHLTRKVLALDAAEAQAAALASQAHALEHDRRHARETIRLMEQSLFWRARRGWAAIGRALGRRG